MIEDKSFMEWLEINHGAEYRKLLRLKDKYDIRFRLKGVECDWANGDYCCHEKYGKLYCEVKPQSKCCYYSPKEIKK